MSEHRHTTWKWVLVIVLIPSFYVLSIGPAFWLSRKYKSPMWGRVGQIVHAPIFYSAEKSRAVHNVMWWYIALWVDVIPPPYRD